MHRDGWLARVGACGATVIALGLAADCSRAGFQAAADCAEVTCSGHGVCVDGSSGVRCHCYAGYQNDVAGECHPAPGSGLCFDDSDCADMLPCSEGRCMPEGACTQSLLLAGAACGPCHTCDALGLCVQSVAGTPCADSSPQDCYEALCSAQGACNQRAAPRDADGDGFGSAACGGDDCDDDVNACGADCFPSNPAAELCDGHDQDCDPASADGSDEAWYGQPCDGPDGDHCAEGIWQCSAAAQSCSDLTADTPDVCDIVDNDCDPASANGSEDPLLGAPCDGPDSDLCSDDSYIGCTAAVLICSTGTDDTEGPPADPTCSDGSDNDCDGDTDTLDAHCELFTEDFDDGNFDGWSVAAGSSWVVESGELSHSEHAITPSLILWDDPGERGDVAMRADVTIASSERQTDWADIERLVLRYAGPDDWCAVFLTDWYAPSNNSFGDTIGYVGIESWQGGVRADFRQTAVTLATDTPYRLEAVLRGGTTPTVEATFDSAATPQLTWTPDCPIQGKVGLSASETHAHLDNVEVWLP